MTVQQALLLVREKFLEEQKGITTSPTAEDYLRACDEYPATMSAAHYLWAIELSKGN